MQRKPFHVFLMHAAFFLMLFGVLGATNEIYARCFQSVGNAVLADFGPGLSVRFQWATPTKRRDSADTRMLGRRAGELDYAWRAVYSARRRGFWPSATLLALTLAVPLGRSRRIGAAVAGIALFNAYFVAEVAVLAAVFFRAAGAVEGAAPETWGHVVPVAKALFNSPITNYAMVFLIWAGLAQPARGIELGSAVGALRRLLNPRAAAPPGAGDHTAPGTRDDGPGV